MTSTGKSKNILLVATTLLALVAGLLLIGPSGQAQAATAAPHITFSPAGPFVGGDPVTVTATGFAAYAPIAISECPTGRVQNGPGDCGRSKNGNAQLVTSDANGTAVAMLSVGVGPLGNATPPAATCDYLHPCDFTALDISASTRVAKVHIPFVQGPPGLGISPGGALRDGARISVVATGFTPTAPVVVAECGAGRPILGPGDCARSAAGASTLLTADADGVVRTTLTLIYGQLGNATPPATVCTEKSACVIDAINIVDTTEEVSTPIVFSASHVTPKVSVTLSKSSVTSGTRVWFRGTITPNSTDEPVYLQRKVHGVWTTVKKSMVSRTSTYSLRWKPISTVDYTWRVLIKRTAYHPGGSSPHKKLRVS